MSGPGVRQARRSRREEYAEFTRQSVLDAARELFATRGFFATKVEDIAELSRVSPATVYAQCGGKQGLLRTLMDTWTATPLIREVIDRIDGLDDAGPIMDELVDAYRTMHDRFGDITRVLVETAPHDEEAAAVLHTANERHRVALTHICARLESLGALRPGLAAAEAAVMISFFFARDAMGRLHAESGWSLDRAQRWLHDSAAAAVLAPAR